MQLSTCLSVHSCCSWSDQRGERHEAHYPSCAFSLTPPSPHISTSSLHNSSQFCCPTDCPFLQAAASIQPLCNQPLPTHPFTSVLNHSRPLSRDREDPRLPLLRLLPLLAGRLPVLPELLVVVVISMAWSLRLELSTMGALSMLVGGPCGQDPGLRPGRTCLGCSGLEEFR